MSVTQMLAKARAKENAQGRTIKNAHEHAVVRANAFLNDPQFIAADRNLARCYLALLARLKSGPIKVPKKPRNNSPGLVG